MQRGAQQLYGFERDINTLIDAFALQAELEQAFSFHTFKSLFKARGCAYIHQAYPGCEHSPEYTQLLYATALDRLDVSSPTAAPDSALWLMHVDKAAAAASGAAAQAASMPQQQWSLAGVQHAAAAVQAAAGAEAAPSAAPVQQQCTMRQTPPGNSLALNNGPLLGGSSHEGGMPELQKQQLTLDLQPHMQQQLPEIQQQQQHLLDPAAAMQQKQDNSPVQLGEQLQPWQQQAGQGALQQQQHQHQQQLLLAGETTAAGGAEALASLGEDFSDEFFSDLLAIFDEAEGMPAEEAEDPAAAGAAAGAAAAAATAADGQPRAGEAGSAAVEDRPALAAGQSPQQQQQQQQQRPSMSVPLAVKAGVVFMLHCLHETQLIRPPVAIYTSLQHLQQLHQAATHFAAAGAAGADALGVLQLLLARQCLLVGQFRRPVQWGPQLPAWLAPPQPRHPDLGLGLAAANRAAARAHNGARVAAVRAAANAARSLRANPQAVDPAVHREALFHIKTALRSLANFKSLQSLCSKYAGARRAMFEPLLRIREPLSEVTQQQPASAAAATQQEEQQRGRKRAAMDRPNSGKRSKRGTAGQDDQAADKAEEEQQQAKAQAASAAAAAAAAARSAGIPELFDCSFGSALSQLASDEAAQMLVLLDPEQNPNRVRRKLKQQQQAQREADAAVAAAAGSGSAHLRELASVAQQQGRGKAKGTKHPAPGFGASGAGALQRQQQQRQGLEYVHELCEAGILHPAELQELQEDESQGSVPGYGFAGQVLQLQRQRRQHTLVLAEQWLRSHDALMMQADDGDEDMP